MPRRFVRRDLHPMVTKPSDEAPVAEIEWPWAMKLGKNDVDHLIDARAMPGDRGRA